MSGKIDPYEFAEIKPISHPRYKWIVLWIDPVSGKKKKRYARSKPGAIEWVEGEFLDLLIRHAGSTTKTRFTFKQACKFYREMGLAGILRNKPMGAAHAKRLKALERLYLSDWDFFDKPIDSTPEDACFEFMRDRASLRKAPAARACEFIKAASALARQERKSKTDPFFQTRTPSKKPDTGKKRETNKKIPNSDQVLELLGRMWHRALISPRKDSRAKWKALHAMSALAATSGMRIGEILCLRRENIDLAAKVVHVIEAIESGTDDKVKPPKTEAGLRAIPLSDYLIEIIKDYLDEVGIDKGPIFLTKNGSFFRRSNINRDLRDVLKGTDLPKIGMHGFRHYYVSRLIAAGADAKTLPTLAGHTDFSFTVKQYGHMLTDVADHKFAVGL